MSTMVFLFCFFCLPLLYLLWLTHSSDYFWATLEWLLASVSSICSYDSESFLHKFYYLFVHVLFRSNREGRKAAVRWSTACEYEMARSPEREPVKMDDQRDCEKMAYKDVARIQQEEARWATSVSVTGMVVAVFSNTYLPRWQNRNWLEYTYTEVMMVVVLLW